MKKLLVISIVLCLMFYVVLVSAQEEEVLKLNFKDAVAIGIENNLDLELAVIRLQESIINFERTQLIGEDEEIEQALEDLEKAELDYLKAEEDLILQIEERYLELFKSEENFLSQIESQKAAERNHELNILRFENGLISEQSLRSSANSLLSSQQSFENNYNSLITLRYRFNQLLGLDFDIKVELIEDIEFVFKPLEISFIDALAIARENVTSLLNAQENLENAIEDVRRADNEYTPLVELEKAKRNKRQAEINLIKAENNLFLSIRSSYLTLKQRENTIELRERELDLAELNYRVALAQFENGDISEDDLNNRLDSFKSAKNNLNDAILNYIRSRRSFLEAIGTPELITRREVGLSEE